jgi:hypothetical protein
MANGQGECCAYCKRALEPRNSNSRVAATKDHIVPITRGGVRKVWCCRQCNGLKANMLLDEWHTFMARYPEWWKMSEFKNGGVKLAHRRELWRQKNGTDAESAVDAGAVPKTDVA